MRPGFIQHRVLLNFCLLLSSVLSGAGNAYAGSAELQLESALQRADELQLAEHETWFALLHYKRETVLLRYISQVDDAQFFLDVNGKTDAKAELAADIRAFFRGPQSNHAQCRFPARWWWLKQQLEITDDYDVHCPQFQAYMTRVSHDRLFLVFPTMYLNNPGSTFGHTFLRFDAEQESVLLSKTLNYAARVDKSDNIVSYVSKGLFGGYYGVFRTRPYYRTVQEYSNIENRDIWEYRLDFSADEIAQLARHVWEVKAADFEYYFFRENCSYRLLALLDAVRPGLQLTANNNFPVYAIPVDTVRALDDAGLIMSKKFRPSLATKIDEYFSAASGENTALVMDIVSASTAGDEEVLNDKLQVLALHADRLAVLEQSYRIMHFHGLSSSVKAKKILKLINAYSLSAPKTAVSDGGPGKASPEEGHDSIRVAAGYGRQNNSSYLNLQFRPAFHDLLDAPQGYAEGAAINVLDARLKWFIGNDSGNGSSGPRLESLSFFNVTSLSPWRRWQKPVSWTLDFRLDRVQLGDARSVKNFISRGGAGFSFNRSALMPFVLLTAEWHLSSGYDRGYSLLAGLQAGLKVNIKTSQVVLSIEKGNALSGFELDRLVSQLQWQYNMQVNHAVRASYKLTEYDFYNDKDWSLNYHYYF